MAERRPDQSHVARMVILLCLAALAIGMVAVAFTTAARSPSGNADPAITASPMPLDIGTAGP